VHLPGLKSAMEGGCPDSQHSCHLPQRLATGKQAYRLDQVHLLVPEILNLHTGILVVGRNPSVQGHTLGCGVHFPAFRRWACTVSRVLAPVFNCASSAPACRSRSDHAGKRTSWSSLALGVGEASQAGDQNSPGSR